MKKPLGPIFTTRKTVTLELPLGKHTRILHPEQVILKIANKYHDIGAYCYALRSNRRRKSGQPQEVVISSLLTQRPKQILQLIKALSSLVTDSGKSLATAGTYSCEIKRFINMADENNLQDCLAGGGATRKAFRVWAADTYEKYRSQKFGENEHNARLSCVCKLLEASTGSENLMQDIRTVKRIVNPNGGTEPLALHDFANAVALNQCLFDGLCDLVLENRPFPYKLDVPGSLGWAENHLWLFPTTIWRLPPHLRNDTSRASTGSNASWAYDYERGRLANVDEIEHRYKGKLRYIRRHTARWIIKNAAARLDVANADAQHYWRRTLGRHAQRAFLFLLICNTGANQQVVRDLETDGNINASVQNQRFRGLKWRAGGKEVTLIAPASFMPRLRRFMELRQYLLNGRKTPHLFFNCGIRNNKPLARLGNHELDNLYRQLLLEIDPQLPKMGPRVLRASVDDYYLRLHDSVVAAAVMGHTVETEVKKYARGSTVDHCEDMSLFMASVSESARRQRVMPIKDLTLDFPPLEQGGYCDSFGHPKALTDFTPVQPNCNESQGCLFCSHRVLIAGEEDARKVASAAYVMEQMILGPKHDEVLRPLIAKCDEDLEKIAAFSNCRAIVERVRKDVYGNENLTLFWADKYQLFLELGIIA
ncbi:MAG: hypothetical protein KIT07_01095 [Anaerolineales bacterium]|nr:hypothetical protein [Rhodocyclaceae bacterium]MCW5886703.1 hypothetical protein [Anaerolineales bacterium]